MKTVTDAVRDLGGVWPSSCEKNTYLEWVPNVKRFVALSRAACVPDYVICTRAEFEAEAERLGYPRVTLRPGDYVRCENISGAVDYHRVAQAFMSAGAKNPSNSPRTLKCFPDCKTLGWDNNDGQLFASVGFGGISGFKRQLTPAQVLNATNAGPDKVQGGNWHERGELPPVGTECEILGTKYGSWSVGVIDYIDQIRCVWHWSKDPQKSIHNYVKHMDFRPLRTDRERWLAAAEHLIEDTTGKPAKSTQIEIIHDAMIDGTLPTPGDNQ